MADETLWRIISDAGIRTRPDFTDPSRWVSATRWRQYGPFATREEALAAAIRDVLSQLETAEQRTERTKQRDKIEGIIGSLFDLL